MFFSGPVVSDPTLAHTAWDLSSLSVLKIHTGPSSPFAHLQGPSTALFFSCKMLPVAIPAVRESKPIVVARGSMARGLMASGLRLKCLCLGPLLFLFHLLLQALPPLEPNHQEPHHHTKIRRRAMLPPNHQEPHHNTKIRRRAMLPPRNFSSSAKRRMATKSREMLRNCTTKIRSSSFSSFKTYTMSQIV